MGAREDFDCGSWGHSTHFWTVMSSRKDSIGTPCQNIYRSFRAVISSSWVIAYSEKAILMAAILWCSLFKRKIWRGLVWSRVCTHNAKMLLWKVTSNLTQSEVWIIQLSVLLLNVHKRYLLVDRRNKIICNTSGTGPKITCLWKMQHVWFPEFLEYQPDQDKTEGMET